MKSKGLIYPDVFCIPYFVSDSYKIIGIGDRFSGNDYDLIFSELYAHEIQLQYLNDIIKKYPGRMILIPGPPYVLKDKTSANGFRIMKEILLGSKIVLAYSDYIKEYYLNIAPGSNIQIFNWPFDQYTIDAIVKNREPVNKDNFNIIINTPLRFNDEDSPDPLLLKEILIEVLASLDTRLTDKIKFHTFAYSSQDKSRFISEKYDRNFPVTLQKKKTFPGFVKFLFDSDAVINFTKKGILGRITLLSASLNKPGIFSDNSDINNSLYPFSTFGIADYSGIKKNISELLDGIIQKSIPLKYYPDNNYIKEYGDFRLSSGYFNKLITDS